MLPFHKAAFPKKAIFEIIEQYFEEKEIPNSSQGDIAELKRGMKKIGKEFNSYTDEAQANQNQLIKEIKDFKKKHSTKILILEESKAELCQRVENLEKKNREIRMKFNECIKGHSHDQQDGSRPNDTVINQLQSEVKSLREELERTQIIIRELSNLVLKKQ